LILLLESRFGELTLAQKEKFYLLSSDKISQILKQLWQVNSLQDFFNDAE